MSEVLQKVRWYLLDLDVAVILRPLLGDRTDEDLYISFNIFSLLAYGFFIFYAWLDITGGNLTSVLRIIDLFFIALFSAYTVNLYRMVRLRRKSWILVHVVYFLVLIWGYLFMRSVTVG